MRARGSVQALLAVVGASLLAAYSCGGSEPVGVQAPTKTGVAVSEHDAGTDMSRCDFKGRTDREVSESSGPGTLYPNIRRVYTVVGEGDESRRVLICREVDTNLDGMKDVVRLYSDKGESLHENADTNYDGKIDTWITFAGGRIGRLEVDTDHNGQPDETHFYVRGRLSRIERDTNQNGKADIWEIYSQGHLQRMGLDIDHDGHVDRWDRDEVAARLAEREEQEEDDKRAREEKAKREAELDSGVTDAHVSARQR